MPQIRTVLTTCLLVLGIFMVAMTPFADGFLLDTVPAALAQANDLPEGTTTLANPLGENVTIEKVIGRIIKALLGFSGAIALLVFVYGGFLWLTSAGNPDRIKKGKQTLIWAVIGLIVIATSYTLVNTVISALAGAVATTSE